MATMVLAFAMIATSQTFRRSWRRRLRSLGVTSCAAIHVLADGASWIWKAVQRALTGCVQTLDIYHACEHLERRGESGVRRGNGRRDHGVQHGRALLLAEGGGRLRMGVGLPAIDTRSNASDGGRSRIAIKYFSKHCGRLNYAERLARGVRSAAARFEGKRTLGLRLKARGPAAAHGPCWNAVVGRPFPRRTPLSPRRFRCSQA